MIVPDLQTGIDRLRKLVVRARNHVHADDLADLRGRSRAGVDGSLHGRDVASLGPLLLPHISVLGGDPSLSPSRSPIPTAPVYLLHGADDNVIPAMESALLAGEIAARGGIAYHLATALVTHAEVDRKPTLGEVWQLVRFFGRVLNE